MAIDLIFLFVAIGAILKGLHRGLIVAIFSFLALIVGLAAAIKFSAILAESLRSTFHPNSRWVLLFSFILIFAVVVYLVHRVAEWMETLIDLAFLGWLSRLAAALLYFALYAAIYSVLLFYGSRSGIVSQHQIHTSRLYPYIEPWGPTILNTLGKLAPFFRNLFGELSTLFDNSRPVPLSNPA